MLQLSICTLCSVIISINAGMVGKIIGGDYAVIKDFPHAVYLQAGCKDETAWICGSSIINEKLLVTAAHCINGCEGYTNTAYYMAAIAGIAKLLEDGGGVSISSNGFIAHEHFDTSLLVCDIGLVGLEKPLPLGDNIKRIIVPQSFPDAKYFYIAGWGMVDPITQADDQKLKSVKQIISYSNGCSQLDSDRFCGIHARSKIEYPASGDSGSGLVTTDYQLAGLVSFSNSLVNPEFVVYTNVSFYYDWILNNIKDAYCEKK